MAGIKQTILDDDPVAFWSIDLDQSGPEHDQLLDEIGNQNPFFLETSPKEGVGYKVEQNPINDIEVVERHSIYNGFDLKNLDIFYGTNPTTKKMTDHVSFFRCPDSPSFDFPTIGQYTVEFAYYMEWDSDWNDHAVHDGAWSDDYQPVIFKNGIFDIHFYFPYSTWYNPHRLQWKSNVTGQTLTCHNLTSSGTANATTTYYNMFEVPDSNHGHMGYPLFHRYNHVVCVFDVEYVDVNEYQSTMKLYINGRLYDSATKTFYDVPPNNQNTEDLYLFARHAGDGVVSDEDDHYQHYPFKMDFMAVYSYAFDENQVSNHYTKLNTYPQIVLNDYPTNYWRFDEPDDPFDTNIYDNVPWSGGHNGKYFYSVQRGQPGPERNIYSYSADFQANSMGRIDINNGDLDISNSYTYEVWFKTDDGNRRGVIFSAIQDDPKWNGFSVWMNSRNNEYNLGSIQVSESQDRYVHSIAYDPITNEPIRLNDGKWHHLVVIRTRENYLKLYIDNNLQEEKYYAPISKGTDGIGWVADMRPGGYHCAVAISEMAWYQYEWQERQIRHRYTYATRYRISGQTLLEGAPVEATVRFYDHITGEKVGEETSSAFTGDYTWYSKNNKYIDVVSYIPDELTTRYRIHGPVIPAEDYDPPT